MELMSNPSIIRSCPLANDVPSPTSPLIALNNALSPNLSSSVIPLEGGLLGRLLVGVDAGSPLMLAGFCNVGCCCIFLSFSISIFAVVWGVERGRSVGRLVSALRALLCRRKSDMLDLSVVRKRIVDVRFGI